MGTIFRTREYGQKVFVLFLVCVTLNGFTGTIFRTSECVGSGVIFEKGCGVEKNSGYEEIVPTIYKGILFSYSLTSWRRLPSW